MSGLSALTASELTIETPAGRTLVESLSLELGQEEKAAIVGRNGVGKSTLLRVLADRQSPLRGSVRTPLSRRLVTQRLETGMAASPGEAQRARLAEAFAEAPGVLLLDEPTHDLDASGIHWLVGQVRRASSALLVVSHNRQLLRCFEHFFVVQESGCRYFGGSFEALNAHMLKTAREEEERYLRRLADLQEREEHNAWVRRRRQRKKNLGRVRELGRGTSRAVLNSNRSYAQESQGRRAEVRRSRIESEREWLKSARKALAVELPLSLQVPPLSDSSDAPIVELQGVSARAGGRTLFEGVDLRTLRQRIGVVGENGCGKSTLLEIVCGRRAAASGTVRVDAHRVGYVAQQASNWDDPESVVEVLQNQGLSLEDAAERLAAHRFPFALADRALSELSPGERLRAALICLCNRTPVPELLVLDEPTDHLDFVGFDALTSFLKAWPGALLVVSHDEEFLESVELDETLCLGG